MSKVHRVGRVVAAAATVTVLAVTASACVTVHGEREIIPSATKAEAAAALEEFTTAYNKADKSFDPSKDADQVTGPLGAINQAGLKAKHKNHPEGNPKHAPLELTDAKFSIPKQAGWPKFFVADTDSNRDRDDKSGYDNRWLIVFTRTGVDAPWKGTYLTLLGLDEVPELKTDADGLAEPVDPADTALLSAPKSLGSAYTDYLGKKGSETVFAPGAHTTGWRAQRDKLAERPGYVRQYIDEPMVDDAYAPLGLRTKDGGALVFFATRHYEKITASKGLDLPLTEDIKALMTGEAKESVTLEKVSNQSAVDPGKGGRGKVNILNRIQGVTGAKGQ
ncbi:hypothetical protein HUT18_06735 [Streptomyces sp. NA04227]|uniref:hypothetical protein n=1 Tax=Streptomyces sp. NA04227 TaxID=2742136 RepID=UPI00159064A7|nr:hypothetical protein [Streptomyces sp. NA04227]QKW06144.1 hypothetical protein HUT18_06735 [Streptomyces sp. NA04227]